MQFSRRRFMGASLAAGMMGGPGAGLTPGFAIPTEQARLRPDQVRMRPEIKPLLKLIDQTPREKCPQMIAQQLGKGVPYRELLAAAFLFAVTRGGHHSVYLIHSAHQMSLDVEPGDRLLPLFWSIDVIKEHLTRFEKTEVPPLQGELPTAERAAEEFEKAMQTWDQPRAERAIVGLARSAGGQQTMARLWKYAARDWSFIGHLPISVAHCQRTLDTIGWQHAEPVLRFVVQDLHRWSRSRTQGQPYARSLNHVNQSFARLKPGWAGRQSDPVATVELLQLIRGGEIPAACDWTAAELVAGRIQAGTIWDAVFVAAAEFMVRFKLGLIRIGNRALHSNTSMNSLHHAYLSCQQERTRFLILLQAVSWMTGFIANEAGRGMLRDLAIDRLPEIEIPADDRQAVEAILAGLPTRKFRTEIRDRSGQDRACQMTFALAQRASGAEMFRNAARKMVCHKSTINAHDFKFPIALFENMQWTSPRWHPHLLSATVHFLSGTNNNDNPAVAAGRAALASIGR